MKTIIIRVDHFGRAGSRVMGEFTSRAQTALGLQLAAKHLWKTTGGGCRNGFYTIAADIWRDVAPTKTPAQLADFVEFFGLPILPEGRPTA